jgi:hypothetical protein
VKEFSYYISSILLELEEIASLQTSDETRDPKFNYAKYIADQSIPLVQSFESESRKLISTLSEGDYIITDPRDAGGYFGGRILWTHPLATNFFGDTIDYDYYDGVYVQ